MIDAHRLLDAGSDRERALLRAGVSEVPSADSVRSAARVLGIVPRAALLAYVVGVVAKGIKWSSLGTYVLAPAIVVTGAIAAVYAVGPRSLPTLAPVIAPAPPTEVAVDPLPSLVASEHMPRAVAVGDDPAPSRSVGAGRSAPAAARDAAGEVQRQVEWIDRARALAEAGDALRALQVLDQYNRQFPRGVLSEEAALLRIEATAARGDRAAASSLAQRFLSDHPRSVHAAKVRSFAQGTD
jgi:hypothetical protein